MLRGNPGISYWQNHPYLYKKKITYVALLTFWLSDLIILWWKQPWHVIRPLIWDGIWSSWWWNYPLPCKSLYSWAHPFPSTPWPRSKLLISLNKITLNHKTSHKHQNDVTNFFTFLQMESASAKKELTWT